MKFPFRVTLLTVLLSLVGATVSVIGVTSYHHARSNADDLSSQLLDQTAARIEQQVEQLLREAIDQSSLAKNRIESGRLRPDDFPAFVAHCGDTLEVTRDLTSMFVGIEATGECTGVTRISGQTSVWESRRGAEKATYEVREYHLADYPKMPFLVDRGKGNQDIRKRPWYVVARRAGRPVWTETYVFLGVEKTRKTHGLTYATPVYGKQGELVAVVTADFELKHLCEFFRRSLQIGENGLPVLIERQAKGKRLVVAHPHAELIVRTTDGGPGTVLTPEEFPDPRVAALAKQMNASQGAGQLFRFVADGEPHLGLARPLRGESAPPWTVCVVIPESEILGRVERSNRLTVLIGLAVLVVAVLASLFVAAQVARPLEKLGRDAVAIGEFRLEPRPVERSVIREVDGLAVAVANMKVGLRSFQKYVPAKLVRSLVASGQDATVGGELRTVTIFFSDVAGFTSISEELSPEQLVRQLSEYLDMMSRQVEAAGGTVDKYIGDAVMAFWGAPLHDPDHALAACTAALACQEALTHLHSRWQAEGKRPFATRIGVHTGEVVVGNIGSESRMNYTIIGDAVNLASRLEGLNKVYGTHVLVSESTYQQAGPTVVGRPIDFVAVKGKRQPVLIYELLGRRGDGSLDELAALHGEALAAYRAKDWPRATELFGRVLALRPGDGPAELMVARCRAYQASPPEPGWDGVSRLDHK